MNDAGKNWKPPPPGVALIPDCHGAEGQTPESFRDRTDPTVLLFEFRDRVKDNYNWLLITSVWIGRSGNSGAVIRMGNPGGQLVFWGGADRGDGQERLSLYP